MRPWSVTAILQAAVLREGSHGCSWAWIETVDGSAVHLTSRKSDRRSVCSGAWWLEYGYWKACDRRLMKSEKEPACDASRHSPQMSEQADTDQV
jgi:hypothetical protein